VAGISGNAAGDPAAERDGSGGDGCILHGSIPSSHCNARPRQSPAAELIATEPVFLPETFHGYLSFSAPFLLTRRDLRLRVNCFYNLETSGRHARSACTP